MYEVLVPEALSRVSETKPCPLSVPYMVVTKRQKGFSRSVWTPPRRSLRHLPLENFRTIRAFLFLPCRRSDGIHSETELSTGAKWLVGPDREPLLLRNGGERSSNDLLSML